MIFLFHWIALLWRIISFVNDYCIVIYLVIRAPGSRTACTSYTAGQWPSRYPCKHAVSCQYQACTDPMLGALAQYRPGAVTQWHVYGDMTLNCSDSCKHAVMCHNWVGSGPILAATAQNWPSSGMFTGTAPRFVIAHNPDNFLSLPSSQYFGYYISVWHA